MNHTVALEGVGRRYGHSWALREVDLELGARVVGLLGPNGAVKTTLLRVFATSLVASTGRLSVFGFDAEVPWQRTEIRRRLGYLPQELGFPGGFTALAFVDYIAVLKEWTEPAARHIEVRRALDAIDLSAVSTKRIRALLDGQRRRMALAQALLGTPSRLLVLDEPMARSTRTLPDKDVGQQAGLVSGAPRAGRGRGQGEADDDHAVNGALLGTPERVVERLHEAERLGMPTRTATSWTPRTTQRASTCSRAQCRV